MSHKVRYNGESRRGLSPALWGDPAKLVSDAELGKCSFMFEDFRGWSTHAVNTNAVIQGDSASWKILADAGVLVNPPTTVNLDVGECGVLVVSGADADNDECYIVMPYEWLKFDATYGYKVYFEARVRKDAIAADSTSGFLTGLVSVADVAAGLLADDTGALVATGDFVGFHQKIDDVNGVDFLYQKDSQTQQLVLANAATLVANTFVKLGFLYDGTPGDLNCLKFFVDGVQKNISANTVTAANIAAATFPDDVTVSPCFGFKMNGTGDANYAHIDWIAAAQYYED